MARELASTRHEETQMLANLRHDLRTPLTSIGGFAEAIADGTASGERAAAAARTIAEEAQRLERLVGELGVVERLREGPAALRPEALDAERSAGRTPRPGSRAALRPQGVSLEVAGAAPGEPDLTFTGDRLAVGADPPEPGRERALGPAQGRPRLAARGAAARCPAGRPVSRSASPTTARASRPGRPRRSSSASSGPIRRAAAAAPAWGWRSCASWPGPTAARPGPRTWPRTAPE